MIVASLTSSPLHRYTDKAMALEHDGHFVICGACRSPLRARLLTVQELQPSGASLIAMSPHDEYVECENCSAHLGQLGAVEAEYGEVVRGQLEAAEDEKREAVLGQLNSMSDEYLGSAAQ